MQTKSVILRKGGKTNYVFACTCKKTKPKPNPKSVIPKQQAAVVTISPIIFFFKKV
jgi:hypothetical protein